VREALVAEWTKLRTLSGTAWLLIGAVGLTVAASAAIAATTHISSGGGQDPTKLALSGVELGQMVLVAFAISAISEEYGTGMILLSLAAVPRRRVLLAAKAANVGFMAILTGVLAVAGCLLVGHQMLPAAGLDAVHGYAPVSISQGPTLRAAGGTVLYFVLVALLSLGVATAVRETAVSIGAALGLLYLPPILAQLLSEPLRRLIQQIAPMSAGLAIQNTTKLRSAPIAPWSGLGVLAAWALAALFLGGLLLRLRDA